MKKYANLFRRIMAVLFAAVLLAGGMARSVSGETPQEKIKRLKAELEDTRAKIESYEGSISSQKDLLAALAEEKALIDQLAEENKLQLERTQRELDHKEETVAASRQVIFENDQLYPGRDIFR